MVAKKRSDGGAKACVIHDLLCDLCLRICEGENFLKFEMMEGKEQEHKIYTPAIVKMRKLRYVYFSVGIARYHKHCNSFQRNNLECLSGIVIGELKDEEMLKCSPHLRKLECIYEVQPIRKRAYPHFDLRFLTRLDSLKLTFEYRLKAGLLEEFRFSSNIRKLTLSSTLSWNMSTLGRLENFEVLKLTKTEFDGEREGIQKMVNSRSSHS